MPDLPFGVRALYTSRGRHELRALSQIAHGGHYICAAESSASRMRPLDLSHLKDAPLWHFGRPPSGRRNDALLYRRSQPQTQECARQAELSPIGAEKKAATNETPVSQPPAPRALRLQPREAPANRVIYLRAMDARSGLAKGPRHAYLLNVPKIRDGFNFAHFLDEVERLVGQQPRRVLSLAHEEVSAPTEVRAAASQLISFYSGARRCIRCTRSSAAAPSSSSSTCATRIRRAPNVCRARRTQTLPTTCSTTAAHMPFASNTFVCALH